MRSLSFSLLDLSGLVALVTIQRGIETIRFTTADRALVVDSITYPPGPGSSVTAIQFPGDGNFSNADVKIMAQLDGLIDPNDAARGMLDDWPITIEWINPNDLASASPMLIGIIGSAAENDRGLLTIAANGNLRLAQERPLSELYALTCRADLGDNQCKVPILADADISAFDIGREQEFVRPDIVTGLLAVSDAYGRVRTGVSGNVEDYANVYFECTTPGTTDAGAVVYSPSGDTTDGTAVFTARDAWLRYARGYAIDEYNIQLTALPDPRASDDAWYVFGVLYVRSGALGGFRGFPIRAWDPSTLQVTLFLPVAVSDIPADTQFELHKGCNLTRDMCFTDFDNIINLRAETFIPPPDFTMSF